MIQIKNIFCLQNTLVLSKEFKKINGKDPLVPLISNTSAKLEYDIKTIIDLLVQQTVSPILWYQCILEAKKIFNLDHFIEVGPKSILIPLIKKILPDSVTSCLMTAEDIEQWTGKN